MFLNEDSYALVLGLVLYMYRPAYEINAIAYGDSDTDVYKCLQLRQKVRKITVVTIRSGMLLFYLNDERSMFSCRCLSV